MGLRFRRKIDVELGDVQGIVLYDYAMARARHFMLQVVDVDKAKEAMGEMTLGRPRRQRLQRANGIVPQITRGKRWPQAKDGTVEKPDYALNVGFTQAGLYALGLGETTMESFPMEFQNGACALAARQLTGDVGSNGTEHWRPPFHHDQPLHVIFSLYTETDEARETWSQLLIDHLVGEDGTGDQHGFAKLASYDGDALDGEREHFGYRDGISQPHIEGVTPYVDRPDRLGKQPLGAFVLGHEGPWDKMFTFPRPQVLGLNGSFAAFRVLEQDVHGFEQFLTRASGETGLDRELMAAKLCGRWRNGVPLAVSPDTDSPTPPIPDSELNDFAYTEGVGYDDSLGHRCPMGAHIRRTNPRDSPLVNGTPSRHRIIRRNHPYGPPLLPNGPEDPEDPPERGLIGYFVCGSIRQQFEFLQAEWVNNGAFTTMFKEQVDPLVANSDPDRCFFEIPMEGEENKVVRGFSPFVRTRGSAYVFLPSITGLRFLASERSFGASSE